MCAFAKASDSSLAVGGQHRRVDVHVDSQDAIHVGFGKGTRLREWRPVVKVASGETYLIGKWCNVSHMSRPGLSMLSPSSWEFVQSELCGLEGVNLDLVSLDSNSHLFKSGISSRHCTPCPTPSSSG